MLVLTSGEFPLADMTSPNRLNSNGIYLLHVGFPKKGQ